MRLQDGGDREARSLMAVAVRLTRDGDAAQDLRSSARCAPAAASPLHEQDDPSWAQITGAQLRAAIGQLPQPFRSICELRFLHGLAYGDIARAMGIPGNTVGTRLLRARRKLRELPMPSLWLISTAPMMPCSS